MATQAEYVSVGENGDITLEPDSHINTNNIEMIQFMFEEGKDITESVSKKNAKNKIPVSYTKKGRTAYTPVTVVYPDGISKSSKFLLEDCIIQYTPALNAQQYTYAKSFVFIGVPTVYIDKIINDAKNNSSINLSNKDGIQELAGYYWQRCTLEKLTHKNTQIITHEGPVNVSLDVTLKEAKASIRSSVVFTLSGSMTNNTMEDELDLADGMYYISMKPTEVFMIAETDIKGPELTDTNNRKKESASISDDFVATGGIAAIAAKRLKGARKV